MLNFLKLFIVLRPYVEIIFDILSIINYFNLINELLKPLECYFRLDIIGNSTRSLNQCWEHIWTRFLRSIPDEIKENSTESRTQCQHIFEQIFYKTGQWTAMTLSPILILLQNSLSWFLKINKSYDNQI
jgi:hypothetical protein